MQLNLLHNFHNTPLQSGLNQNNRENSVNEQKFIANYIPDAKYSEIDSIFGHDGFLVELEELNAILKHLA